MNERDLDRAIDAATRQMMAREPGRALTANVMMRVRSDVEAPRRFVWAAAAAGIVMSIAIATVLMNRPAGALPVPPELHLAVAETVVQPSVPMDFTPAMPRAGTTAAPAARRASASPAPRAADVAPGIEPIDMPPIAVAAIAVPLLEREATSIDTIRIEPLTIEPLATSND